MKAKPKARTAKIYTLWTRYPGEKWKNAENIATKRKAQAVAEFVAHSFGLQTKITEVTK